MCHSTDWLTIQIRFKNQTQHCDKDIMFETDVDESRGTWRLWIHPNQSLSRRGRLIFLFLIGTLALAIAVTFAFFGAWLILPFAGLEILVLGMLFRGLAARLSRCETIEACDPQTVFVTANRGRNLTSYTLPRRQLSAALVYGSIGGADRVYLRGPGVEVEVGACLAPTQRRRLARVLTGLLAHPANPMAGLPG